MSKRVTSAGSDPEPLTIIALAEAVAKIGPVAISAIKEAKAWGKGREARKAIDDIQAMLRKARMLAERLAKHRELNHLAGDFKDDIESIQIKIPKQLAAGVTETQVLSNAKLDLHYVANRFTQLDRFPFDENLDPSRASLAKDFVKTINGQLVAAKDVAKTADLEAKLQTISHETSRLLTETFYASQALEKVLSSIEVK